MGPERISRLVVSLLILSVASAFICRGETLEEKVDQLCQRFDRPDVPGASVAVIRNGKVIFKKGYGLADLGKRIPVDESTNFRLASLTKQFTAMTIMMLKEQGLLCYDDPLTKYFPDFPEIGKSITIRHLLGHTSGIISYEDILPEDLTVPLKDQDVLELVKTQHGAYFTPGTQFKYSNTGYAFLALIVEKVSGKHFAAFLKEKIFEPLGMNDTVAYEKGVSTVSRRAYGYKETENGFAFADQSLTSSVLGDGGIYSSVMDYFKWDQALYTEKLVRRQTLQEAFSPALLPDGTSTHYGFGWYIREKNGERILLHNGGTCGFSNAVRRVPGKNLTVIVLANRHHGNVAADANQLIDWLLSNAATGANPGKKP